MCLKYMKYVKYLYFGNNNMIMSQDNKEPKQQLSLNHNPKIYSDLKVFMSDGATLVESMAIIQYLEETRPKPSLLPKTPLLRARMREICETVVSGIQPLQNIGLLSHFDSEDEFKQFTKYWTERGLQTLEELLQKSAGKFCVNDQLSMADVCLVPQLYSAVTRHKLSLDKFPTVSKLYETLLKEKTFSETHPENIKLKRVSQ